MNKRILDGGALWKSDKIALIKPEWMRAEYANWIPLALANGVFESDTRRIWATIYSYNRPNISFEDADRIKREFCRVGLLFLWPDEPTGKSWGYFTGIEKQGRLPPKSRLDNKHEEVGPVPPVEALRNYIELTRSKALDVSVVSQWLANGSLGSGSGLGIGKDIREDSNRPHDGVSSIPPLPSDEQEQAVLQVWAYYMETLHRHPKLYTYRPKRKGMGILRLRDLYPRVGDPKVENAVAMMKLCIDRLAQSPFHNGQNPQGRKYIDWEILFRSTEQMETWLNDDNFKGAA